MSEENSESSVTTPLGSFAFKGKKTAEFIAIFSLFLMSLMGYILWEHKAEAKENGTTLVTALKEISQSNRVLACLMATKQEEREAKLAQCERIAR
jgi:hypothetical protein